MYRQTYKIEKPISFSKALGLVTAMFVTIGFFGYHIISAL